MMTTVTLVLGIGMLILGRKPFWFFVGAVGFVAGMHFAPMLVGGLSEHTLLIIGAVCGLAGVFLAIFVQKVAVGAAGFFAGGYLAMNAAEMYFHLAGQIPWIAFAVGGVLGALLLSRMFEWALIVLSSVVGAVLVSQGLHVHDTLIITIALSIIGILIQARLYKGKSKQKN